MTLRAIFWLECSRCEEAGLPYQRLDALLVRAQEHGWEVPHVERLDDLLRSYTLCPPCRRVMDAAKAVPATEGKTP